GGGKTAGGHDLGVHVAGSDATQIRGTVFQDLAGNGTWDPSDPGLHDGVLVYVDLNNNGKLDPGEPSQQPSLEGAFAFTHLAPGTHHLRLLLGAEGIANTMRQTTPAGDAPFDVTLTTAGAVFNGVDFGVQVLATSSDFNNDGHPDLVLTDPATGDVYVQLWNR